MTRKTWVPSLASKDLLCAPLISFCLWLPFCIQLQGSESPHPTEKPWSTTSSMAVHGTKSGLLVSHRGFHWQCPSKELTTGSEHNKMCTWSSQGHCLPSTISLFDSEEVGVLEANPWLLSEAWIQLFLLVLTSQESLPQCLPGMKFPEGLHTWKFSQ